MYVIGLVTTFLWGGGTWTINSYTAFIWAHLFFVCYFCYVFDIILYYLIEKNMVNIMLFYEQLNSNTLLSIVNTEHKCQEKPV